jgi:thiol-disulfide isomerase/thioredoxin
MDSVFASLPVSQLDVEEQTGAPTTLGALAAGKPLVLDFWHTRCVKCPQALSKLDGVAPKHAGVTFAACALSLGSETEGTQDQVLELLEGQWENLTHLYMTFEAKEQAKKAFGFKAVPFVAVFSADGALRFAGEPGDVDFATVFDAPPVAQLAADLESKASVSPTSVLPPADKTFETSEAAAKLPLGEANRAAPTAVGLGFGNDDDDF